LGEAARPCVFVVLHRDGEAAGNRVVRTVGVRRAQAEVLRRRTAAEDERLRREAVLNAGHARHDGAADQRTIERNGRRVVVHATTGTEVRADTHVGDRHAQPAVGQRQRDRDVDVRTVGAVPIVDEAGLATRRNRTSRCNRAQRAARAAGVGQRAVAQGNVGNGRPPRAGGDTVRTRNCRKTGGAAQRRAVQRVELRAAGTVGCG